MLSTRTRQVALAGAITAVALTGAGVAFADGHAGGATTGVIDMSSSYAGSYSTLDLGKPGHGDQFSAIKNLSLDYAAVKGGCIGGSPRFVVEMQNPGTHDTGFLTVYVGTPPNFTCAPGDGFVNSGNLADTSAGNRWAVGNSGSYVNYSDSSIQAFAGWKVNDVFLVVDSGWAFNPGGEDIVVNNVTLNDHVATADVHVK